VDTRNWSSSPVTSCGQPPRVTDQICGALSFENEGQRLTIRRERATAAADFRHRCNGKRQVRRLGLRLSVKDALVHPFGKLQTRRMRVLYTRSWRHAQQQRTTLGVKWPMQTANDDKRSFAVISRVGVSLSHYASASRFIRCQHDTVPQVNGEFHSAIRGSTWLAGARAVILAVKHAQMTTTAENAVQIHMTSNPLPSSVATRRCSSRWRRRWPPVETPASTDRR